MPFALGFWEGFVSPPKRFRRNPSLQAGAWLYFRPKGRGFKPKVSFTIKMMALHSSKNVKDANKKRMEFTTPACFSLIDNPAETLKLLCDFAFRIQTTKFKQLFIDFRPLKYYDLSANALLDIVIDELEMQLRQNAIKTASVHGKRRKNRCRTPKRISWAGTYPSDPHLRRFVQAMGVIKHLRIEHEYPPESEQSKLSLFEKRRKYYEAPDPAYVRHLDAAQFPGTLIGIRFPLTTTMMVSEPNASQNH